MKAIKIIVRYYSFFQDITGKEKEYIYLKEPRVVDLLKLLGKKYRSESAKRLFGVGSMKNRMEFVVSVNGRVADLECPLKDNDEVTLLRTMGGG